jgi:two-component system chemotaxis sensor kinase CheA
MTKDPYKYYRIEARELLDGLSQGALELEKGQGGPDRVGRLLRLAHTLKGASRVVKQGSIAEIAHAIEDVLAPFRDGNTPVPKDAASQILRHLDGVQKKILELEASTAESRALPVARAVPPAPGPEPAARPAAAQDFPAEAAPKAGEAFETVRVDLSEMDSFLDQVTELGSQGTSLRAGLVRVLRSRTLARTLYRELSQPDRSAESTSKKVSLAEELRHELRSAYRLLAGDIDQVESRIERIHESAHRIRLVPAAAIFPTLERAVRDAAQSVERSVAFHASGGDQRLDAQVLGGLRDALLHVVRNAVAHGIEPASERGAAGKPAEGNVRMTVEQRGRRVAFVCVDDGRGIDVEGIRAAALRRGWITPAEASRLGLEEAVQLLLRGGLSTTTGVTELSGRGIGLDVVRETVERLKGELSVRSVKGRGTKLEVVVPISLSSRAVLMVEAADLVVSIPLESVVTNVLLKPADVSRSANRDTIRHEARMIPLIGLAAVLGRGGVSKRVTSWPAVIVRAAGEEIALRVDRVVGASRVVVRPLPPAAQAEAVVYGASLDPEGNPLLALDPAGLVAAARTAPVAMAPAQVTEQPPILVIDDSLTTRMLVQSILESAGYRVDLASSGEEGLVKARERRYGLFICDVEMPGMNGFEFVTRTRADVALKEIPSILVTSLASAEDKSRGKRAGARAYIVKSEFDQGSFIQIIRGLME